MKHTKPFGSFINEAREPEHSALYDAAAPMLNKAIGMLALNADPVKIQAEINKALKVIADNIRTKTQAGQTEGGSRLDWNVTPKAPVFILNLVQRYPQNEKKYYDLWYKAANRNPVFNYGGAINIFKAYAKREDLMLEEFADMPDEELAVFENYSC